MAALTGSRSALCGSCRHHELTLCSWQARKLRCVRQYRAGHRLSVQAIQVSGPQPSFDERPDSVDADTQRMSAQLIADMREKIRTALEAERVEITDAYGNGQHVSIDVVSDMFEGQSSMKRQRMVYKAIWYELQSAVHAVDSMTTKTPAEAATA